MTRDEHPRRPVRHVVSHGTMTVWAALLRLMFGLEGVVDRRLNAFLRRRPGWGPTVSPYISYGITGSAHVRARVLLSRRDDQRDRPGWALLAGLAPFLSVEIPGEEVSIEVAGQRILAVAGPEGYVEAALHLPELSPGWHEMTFGITGDPGYSARGRLLIVDPAAKLGVVSDIDDTIIHTGLTRLVEAIRTTLFTPEHVRKEIAGASEFYRGLVGGPAGPAQIFYVSTGAWNLHPVLERFLVRYSFPEGPVLMTDWGPSAAWLFREASVVFKCREITQLFEEHPQLMWVLVGDSGQDDPEAYAAVALAHPERVHAVYIREVSATSPVRAARVRQLTANLSRAGVGMLMVADSAVAADDAHARGLIDEKSRDRVRQAVEGGSQGGNVSPLG
ncbi:MAG: App1 family protein [Nocardioidaceae bacterium]